MNPRAGLDMVAKRKIPLSGIRTLVIQPVA
jgi:hypothetical protein